MQDDVVTTSRKEALLELLDDPSPVVRKELLKEFESLGSEGRRMLKDAANGSNRFLSWHARWFLAELDNSNPIEEFTAFIKSLQYDLESGWLLLSRVAHPDLDVGKVCMQFDELARRCKELIIEPASSHDRCLILNRVLFHEYGFRGNIDKYNDPANSFANEVLATRKGLPIALSLLYILVGQRIGAHLEPIAAPGRFLVGSFEDDEPFYVDPFERGRILKPSQLFDKLEIKEGNTTIGIMAPASIRETLCRCCRNLVKHYAENGQPQMSNLYKSFIVTFTETYRKRSQP